MNPCRFEESFAEKDSEIASLRQGKQIAQEAVLAQLEKVKELEAEIAGLKAAHRGSMKDSMDLKIEEQASRIEELEEGFRKIEKYAWLWAIEWGGNEGS